MAEAVLSTQGLSKYYDKKPGVDGVDMTIRQGEIYGFLGQKGDDKMTTISILMGLIRPTSGSVE
jgi:ABC-type multidrug transport system ATPase subunit